MHQIINAAYCTGYDGYDFLLDVAKETQTGVELAVCYDKPEFMHAQNAQRLRFSQVPLTLHGPFINVEATSAPGTLENKQFLDAYREALDVYAAFGAHSMVLHTHKMHYIPEAEKENLRGYTVATLEQVAQMAEPYKANLTVENVGSWIWDSVLFNEEQFIALFDRLPQSMGCLLDVGHALINRWDIFHVVHALNTRIRSYHLHNNSGCKDSHRPVFEAGNRYTAEEMRELLQLTNRYSPDAEWILEYAPGAHITRELMVNDINALKALNG